jgi:hypothetical protein
MTQSNAAYLKQFHDTTKAQGAKRISSDFALEIEGFEHNWILTKQCPWPELSTAGEIEVSGPLGSATWEQQQLKTNQQGAIAFMETTAGSIDQMLVNLIASGGKFNAKIYEGTPTKYLEAKLITDCFIQLDNADRDWENRSQILTFSGTLFFHYYGEKIAGNSADYR